MLNSRGLDVSWIDKLKSQLMGLAFETGATAGRQEAIKELHLIWQDIYRTIGKQKYLTAETVRFAGTLSGKPLLRVRLAKRPPYKGWWNVPGRSRRKS